MLKKTMTTVDFGGTERTEDYYFNLTRAEIMEMELTTEGGLVQMINRITAAQSQLEAIRNLERQGLLDKLPDKLRRPLACAWLTRRIPCPSWPSCATRLSPSPP